MTAKKVLTAIGISLILLLGLLFLAYDFKLTLQNLSDAMFMVGLGYIFPGLIEFTDATDIFTSTGYLMRRMFTKAKGSHMRTLNDYVEYKSSRNNRYQSRAFGKLLMGIGGFYAVTSFLIGSFV